MYVSNVANTTDLVFPIQPWVLSLYVILAIVGIVGNILVLLVLAYNVSVRRSSFGVYIGGLAVVDLLAALVGIPVYLLSTGNFKNHPIGVAGNIMCKIITGYNIMIYFFVVSIYIQAAMTLERYFLICKPHSCCLAVTSVSRAKKVITGIWLWSLIIRINNMITEVYAEPSEARIGAHCKSSITHRSKTRKVIHLIIFTLQYIIPLTIMIFSYAKIIRELMRQTKNQFNVEGGNIQKENLSNIAAGNTIQKENLTNIAAGNIQNDALLSQLRMRQKTANMIIWIIVAYLILWTPNQILVLCYNFDLIKNRNTSWNADMIQFCFVLYFMSCIVNPVIYAFRSKMFRDGFAATFMCNYCSGERSRQHYTTISDVPDENIID